MKAYKTDGINDLEPYSCKYDWPEDSFCQCGDQGTVLVVKDPKKVLSILKNDKDTLFGAFTGHVNIVSEGKYAYQTAFFEACITQHHALIRGEGKTIEDAEEDAWWQYQAILNCPKHEFEPLDYVDGQGVCKHCQLYAENVLPIKARCIICGGKRYGLSDDGAIYCKECFILCDKGQRHFRRLEIVKEMLKYPPGSEEVQKLSDEYEKLMGE